MPMEATLKIDHSDVDAAIAKVQALKSEMRNIAGGGGAAGGGAAGGKNPIEEGAKGFREWDNQLRKVEHTGRGVLGLLGIGGGILGVAHLVTKEITDWYAAMDRVNKKEEEIGANMAKAFANPGARQRFEVNRAEANRLGVPDTKLAQWAADPTTFHQKMYEARKEKRSTEEGIQRGESWAIANDRANRAAVERERGVVSGTPAQQAQQRKSIQHVTDERIRAELLRSAGLDLGDEVGAVHAWLSSVVRGRGGTEYTTEQWNARKKRMEGESAAPIQVILVGDHTARDGTEGN